MAARIARCVGLAAAAWLAAAGCGREATDGPAPRLVPPRAVSEADAGPEAPGALAEAPAPDRAEPAPTPAEAAPAEAAWVKWLHRDGPDPLRALLDAELAAAAAAGDRVLVIFTADWCTPCEIIKHFLAESEAVQRAVRGGRFLFVDVDEWRGPAHALIPGTDPSKLPLLVRVDERGGAVVQAYGTELGLLSEEETGANLARMLRGEAPARPAYLDDDALQTSLLRAQALRQRERAKGVTRLEARVVARQPAPGGAERVTLDLTIRNPDSRRRWFALPTAGAPPEGPLALASRTFVRFADHVRAGFWRFAPAEGPPLDVIPAGGHGDIVLDGLTVVVPAGTPALAVWELDRVEIDGSPLTFDKKVPHHLRIPDAGAQVPLSRQDGPASLRLTVAASHAIPLEAPAAPAP